METKEENDIFPELGVQLADTPERELYLAIRERRYARAYALLRKRDTPLTGKDAADCLLEAMDCTRRLFRAVLDACGPEPLLGSVTVETEEGEIEVRGTLLVLAAAVGCGEHVALLLERGYDVNAATPESGDADCYYIHYTSGPEYRRCAMPGNELYLRRKDCGILTILGCTPLAAAIAFDNPFTTEVLLKAPGVWRLESSAVCRAAALRAEGLSRASSWVIPWEGPEAEGAEPLKLGACLFPQVPGPLSRHVFSDMVNTLFPRVNMQPGSFADFCSPELLEAQYKSGACTEADARAVLEKLDRPLFMGEHSPLFAIPRQESYPSLKKKLLLTAKYFPALCRQPDQLWRLLNAYVLFCLCNEPGKALLRRWKALGGKTRDISQAMPRISRLPTARLRTLLPELAEGGCLVAAADSYIPGSLTELKLVCQYVRFIPSPLRRGVSALAHGALNLPAASPELHRLIRGGLLAREPREELLLLAPPPLRPLILTMEAKAPEETYNPGLYAPGFRHFFPGEPEPEWYREFFCGGLSPEDCLPRILSSGFWHRCVDRGLSDAPEELNSATVLQHLCFAPNAGGFRAYCRLHPDFLAQELNTEVKDRPVRTVCGPPIAQAAAAGRTETLRACLELNPQPDQFCTVVMAGSSRAVKCTPLLVALLLGREEAARLLLEAGAVLDLRREPCASLLRAAGPEALALAERLRNEGN